MRADQRSDSLGGQGPRRRDLRTLRRGTPPWEESGPPVARCRGVRRAYHRAPWPPTCPAGTPTASPARRARTSSSTPTTRSTGTRGAPRRSTGRASSTGRSSSRSATRPATGATSWSASRSRTRPPPPSLNDRFVAIKVDREERPDLDALYMGAVQAMTGPGRLADERVPDARRPAVLRRHLLPGHAAPRHAVVPPGARGRPPGVDRTQRTEVERAGGRLVEALVEQQRVGAGGWRAARPRGARHRGDRDRAGVRPGQRRLGRRAQVPAADDDRGAAPAARRASGDARPLAIARREPRRDGGGRHPRPAGRRVPPLRHGRALARAPLRADALRQRPARPRLRPRVGAHRRSGRTSTSSTGTLDYLLRELRTPEGGFAASQDADTDGEEGATFVWSAAEVREVLGEDGRAVLGGVRGHRRRNWEGHTILSRVRDDAELAERFGLAPTEVAARLAAARAPAARGPGAPAAARARRQGARGLERARDRGVRGRRAVDGGGGPAHCGGRRRGTWRRRGSRPTAVTGSLLGADGRLRRSWKDGRASADGVLEDYANLADGLLALYEATGDERWYRDGRRGWSRRSWPGSRTRPAGSGTRPTTARRWSPGRAASRTTRSRRAGRWRRRCCSGSRR